MSPCGRGCVDAAECAECAECARCQAVRAAFEQALTGRQIRDEGVEGRREAEPLRARAEAHQLLQGGPRRSALPHPKRPQWLRAVRVALFWFASLNHRWCQQRGAVLGVINVRDQLSFAQVAEDGTARRPPRHVDRRAVGGAVPVEAHVPRVHALQPRRLLAVHALQVGQSLRAVPLGRRQPIRLALCLVTSEAQLAVVLDLVPRRLRAKGREPAVARRVDQRGRQRREGFLALSHRRLAVEPVLQRLALDAAVGPRAHVLEARARHAAGTRQALTIVVERAHLVDSAIGARARPAPLPHALRLLGHVVATPRGHRRVDAQRLGGLVHLPAGGPGVAHAPRRPLLDLGRRRRQQRRL
eukprot:1936270-Prymnesium_polylepis.4